jgi:hypothetical protein
LGWISKEYDAPQTFGVICVGGGLLEQWLENCFLVEQILLKEKF